MKTLFDTKENTANQATVANIGWLEPYPQTDSKPLVR